MKSPQREQKRFCRNCEGLQTHRRRGKEWKCSECKLCASLAPRSAELKRRQKFRGEPLAGPNPQNPDPLSSQTAARVQTVRIIAVTKDGKPAPPRQGVLFWLQ